jgi:hypothetical protein
MLIKPRDYLLVLFIFLFALVHCCDTGPTASSPNLDSSMVIKMIQEFRHGKSIFQNLCEKCHAAPERHMADQHMFDQIFERLPPPAEEYFINFVSDSRRVKESGDQHALEMDQRYAQGYEHNFKDSLSEVDFKGLITYIKIAGREEKQK